MIDKKTKYRLLYDDLYRRLKAGEWLPGDRLPTEVMLAKSARLSLGTVQKTLRLLEQERVVVRRHGSGTYAASMSPSPNEIFNFYFLQDDEQTPLPLYTKILDVCATAKQGPWSRFLRHSGEFVRIRRVTSVNFEFKTYMELYVRKSQFSKLLDMPKRSLDGPALNRTMFNMLHLPPTKFTYRIWLAIPPTHVYSHIQVERGAPCLHWEIGGYVYRESPLFYQQVYLPPAKRKLKFDTLPQMNVEKSKYSAKTARARIKK